MFVRGSLVDRQYKGSERGGFALPPSPFGAARMEVRRNVENSIARKKKRTCAR